MVNGQLVVGENGSELEIKAAGLRWGIVQVIAVTPCGVVAGEAEFTEREDTGEPTTESRAEIVGLEFFCEAVQVRVFTECTGWIVQRSSDMETWHAVAEVTIPGDSTVLDEAVRTKCFYRIVASTP